MQYNCTKLIIFYEANVDVITWICVCRISLIKWHMVNKKKVKGESLWQFNNLPLNLINQGNKEIGTEWHPLHWTSTVCVWVSGLTIDIFNCNSKWFNNIQNNVLYQNVWLCIYLPVHDVDIYFVRSNLAEYLKYILYVVVLVTKQNIYYVNFRLLKQKLGYVIKIYRRVKTTHCVE